ncbi:hypothetical protein F1721_13775 [Saccharopolyspora hirsuta]|uniref:LapA family protein n=1 Tax=Saccharopolyspora hirsuta TaxID=1837 RepID=A0A5M7BWA4_SACHI|nr:hypothetical protein F1721_13775 [Saccharopolyspora hirsuta]MBF6507965.1 hypothetical protein [Nocardia farcinica]
MTWLFTQVWLWSLAAFALGALITWLLFVRPLQRRLAELSAEYPDYEYDRDDYQEPDTAREPLDLLDSARPHDPDEPPIGDWDRPPRAWADPRLRAAEDEDTENTWFRKWDEEAQHAPDGPPDVAVTAVQPRVPAAAEPNGSDTVTWDAPETSGSSDAVDDPGEKPDRRDEPVAEEPDTEVTPVEAEPEVQANPAAASSFSGQLEDAERLSGQLRSLFESEPKSGADTPYVPPVGAEATQVMPAVADDEDVPPLPRRTPGAGPHPGRDSGWSGPMVKGHSASRQYHTPESPQYEEIVADVWFRSAADAEIAGFEPWNGQRVRD